MAIEQLRIYRDAQEIAARIADNVMHWPLVHQRTLGEQLLRSSESITNNISEGYARVNTGERLQLLWYAEGSIQETRNGLRSCRIRRLLADAYVHELDAQLVHCSISLIEFMHAILIRDPDYIGPFRSKVEQRRAWRIRPKQPLG